jgi:hypothetical protein
MSKQLAPHPDSSQDTCMIDGRRAFLPGSRTCSTFSYISKFSTFLTIHCFADGHGVSAESERPQSMSELTRRPQQQVGSEYHRNAAFLLVVPASDCSSAFRYL